MKTVVVCGSRGWRDSDTIRDRLRDLPAGSVVISGAARGADAMAATIARGLGLQVIEMPAFWREGGSYNPRAGFERNIRMLERDPDLVIGFWDGRSTGTKHTLDEAMRRHLRIEVIYPRRSFPGGG